MNVAARAPQRSAIGSTGRFSASPIAPLRARSIASLFRARLGVREIRALRIYEGATEVQKLIAARELLKARPA
jgi:alkylation response protein AidB-like acyl-CoA dehydrogenase